MAATNAGSPKSMKTLAFSLLFAVFLCSFAANTGTSLEIRPYGIPVPIAAYEEWLKTAVRESVKLKKAKARIADLTPEDKAALIKWMETKK